VIIVEEINNVEYVIGSGYLHQGSKQTLTFTPTIDVAKLKIYGPFDEMLIATTCTKKAKTVQHTYLVDVCDEDGDRYRFGFNGMEKDNELKGIGNSLDFSFRIHDSRIARFLSIDPLSEDYPWFSPYQFAGNTPIQAIDLEGLEPAEKINTNYNAHLKIYKKPIPHTATPTPAPGSLINASLRFLGRGIAGTLGLVFSPIETGRGASWDSYPPEMRPDYGTPFNPAPGSTPSPSSAPQSGKHNDREKKGKYFYVTYTKTKYEKDGSRNVYTGRTSGWTNNDFPSQAEVLAATQRRESQHSILNSEDYEPAIVDKVSLTKAAIRGREQQMIDFNGGAQSEGGSSRNKIRGVSRTNKKRHIYQSAAKAEFGSLKNNNPVDSLN
jgi:RHS repeat-associated protein